MNVKTLTCSTAVVSEEKYAQCLLTVFFRDRDLFNESQSGVLRTNDDFELYILLLIEGL